MRRLTAVLLFTCLFPLSSKAVNCGVYLQEQIVPLITQDLGLTQRTRFMLLIKGNVSQEFIKSSLLELGVYTLQVPSDGSETPTLWIDHLKFQLYLDRAVLENQLTPQDLQANAAKIEEMGRPNVPDTLEVGSSTRRFFSVFNELSNEAQALAQNVRFIVPADGRVNPNQVQREPLTPSAYQELREKVGKIASEAASNWIESEAVVNAIVDLIERQKPFLGWKVASSSLRKKYLDMLVLSQRMREKIHQDMVHVLSLAFYSLPSPDNELDPRKLVSSRFEQFREQTRAAAADANALSKRIEKLQTLLSR